MRGGWEGQKKNQENKPQSNPVACEGCSAENRRTASHYLLFGRAVAVAFCSLGKPAHIHRKHLTTLAPRFSACGCVHVHCICAHIYRRLRRSVFTSHLLFSRSRQIMTGGCAGKNVLISMTTTNGNKIVKWPLGGHTQ